MNIFKLGLQIRVRLGKEEGNLTPKKRKKDRKNTKKKEEEKNQEYSLTCGIKREKIYLLLKR